MLKTIARLNGVSFPSTMALAWRWLRGRDGYLSRREAERKGRPEDAYCAEVVAVTLRRWACSADAPTNWYDPGRFWSGDDRARAGVALGGEVEVVVPPAPRPTERCPAQKRR